MKKTTFTKVSLLALALSSFAGTAWAQLPNYKAIEEQKAKELQKEIQLPSQLSIMPLVTPESKQVDVIKNDERPFLGVSIEAHEAGVKITQLNSASAAEKAGLKGGDVIKAVNGKAINSIDALQSAIRSQKIGDVVKIEYIRNGATASVDATLQGGQALVAERREYHIRRHHDEKATHFDPCKKLEELRGEALIGVFINQEENAAGANISSVIEKTGAAKSELKAGDFITKINGEAVSDYESLRKVLKQYKPGQTVRISYLRGDKTGKTRVELSSLADRNERQVKMLEDLCEKQTPGAKLTQPTNEEKSNLPEVLASPSLDVFPNPAKDFVNINFAGGSNEQATISVLTIEGKEVMRLEVNENSQQFTQQLDLSKLAKGIYLVTVKQGKSIVSKQVALK